MLPLLLVAVIAQISLAVPLPFPQLTEEQFRARARSLDNEIPNNIFMISGYSQVRRQGGRSFADPIDFPTLTVKNPNQLYVNTPSKVKISVADPVYDDKEKELETIAKKIEEINQLEGKRIEEQNLQQVEDDIVEEPVVDNVEEEVTEELDYEQEEVDQQETEEYEEDGEGNTLQIELDAEQPEDDLTSEDEELVSEIVITEEDNEDDLVLATTEGFQAFEVNENDVSDDIVPQELLVEEVIGEDEEEEEVVEDSSLDEEPVVIDQDGLVVEEVVPPLDEDQILDIVEVKIPEIMEAIEIAEGSGFALDSSPDQLSLEVSEVEDEFLSSTQPSTDYQI